MALELFWKRMSEEVLAYLPERLRRSAIATLKDMGGRAAGLSEIRVREGMPPVFVCYGSETLPTSDGYTVDREDITRMFNLISANSVHTFEDELRNGYVTVRGGHRIGMAGKAVLEAGRVKTLRNIRSFNIRIARDCPGAARHILPWVVSDGWPVSTLIAGPPGSGKTTVLRELTRLLGAGTESNCRRPLNVGVVDERSEIAGSFGGVPQNDVGPRADVLDACPKAEGMMMLIRAMAPDVLITDEIGTLADATAITEALSSGVIVFASAHASTRADLCQRPAIQQLTNAGAFERLILLSSRFGPGTIEEISDGRGKTLKSGPEGGIGVEPSSGR